ncbi:hypothetical protein [Candidatus Caldatribacterium sp.]|uniref:hypothetical protein n=1 Tax=Candidatus Caldatribacterium sp. TaxID=2282143 RepID=UPI0038497C46|nr:hypothetical protein [Candidatus Caldatribacterium sp.]
MPRTRKLWSSGDDPEYFLDYVARRSGLGKRKTEEGEQDYMELLREELMDLITQLTHLVRTSKDKSRYVYSLESLIRMYLKLAGDREEEERAKSPHPTEELNLEELVERLRGEAKTGKEKDLLIRLDELVFEELEKLDGREDQSTS